MTSERDWEYNVNKTGPNTEPWWTPYKSGRGFEVGPLTMTDWNRSETYEQNLLRTLPLIPKVISRRLRRIEWSSVSNAALRSRRATSETNFWSEFVSKLSMTLSTAVSTLWPFLYADWFISSRLLSKRCCCNWRRTTLSRSLEINGRLDTDLKYFRLLQSSQCFFRRGTTTASLSLDGTTSDRRDSLIMRVVRGTRIHRLIWSYIACSILQRFCIAESDRALKHGYHILNA